MVGGGQVAVSLEDRSFRSCLLATWLINSKHAITNTTSLQSERRPSSSFLFEQLNGGFVAANFYSDNCRAPGDWLVAGSWWWHEAETSKEQFLADDDRSAELHEDRNVRKPSAEVMACMMEERRKTHPSTTFIPSDFSKSKLSSFKLLMSESSRSDDPLHSNLSEILGGLKGRRTLESKLPNKRWIVMSKRCCGAARSRESDIWLIF